jgi:hypothetical protein
VIALHRSICPNCHIPVDAGFFDESSIKTAPGLEAGEQREVVLAQYRLHRNYEGVLLYFAQFIKRRPLDDPELPAVPSADEDVETPGYRWEIRSSGQPLDPYLSFEHIINPWGLNGFPLAVRLPEGSVVQLVVSAVGATDLRLDKVGGRIVGRFWYDTEYGGSPNRL